MTKHSESIRAAVHDLVVANRILGHEGVVDAFGHISIRHPENPERYLLARSRSPELVEEDDLIEFDLNSNAIDLDNRVPYAERYIHGCIYRARPDVNSVCHSHAHVLIPFTIVDAPVGAVWVMAASIGEQVPNWDIRDDFPDEKTMLVVNDAIGRSLANTLGQGAACLMRGHGAVIATGDIKRTVLTSIGLMLNADMQTRAHLLTLGRPGTKVKALSAAEVESTRGVLFSPLGADRAWEYFATRAGFPPQA
jgi:HCOMODA/2-hydroxy-3-carboxy-muconic semialdehyde decarboxylase